MYNELSKTLIKPDLFEKLTTITLWNTPHISKQMLELHISPDEEAASRNHKFIDDSVTFIDHQVSGVKGKSLIDFGCGPGLYTSRFAKLGASVTGLDFSTNSLTYAREQAKLNKYPIDYHEVNYLEYEPHIEYDLATLIYCDYCALPDKDRKNLLTRIHKSLKTDGYFILDVHTITRFRTLKESSFIQHNSIGAFFTPNPHILVGSTHLYTNDAVSLDLYTIIEKENKWQVYNWLKHFTPETITKELEAGGFKVKGIYDDIAGSDYSGNGHDMAIVAKKL